MMTYGTGGGSPNCPLAQGYFVSSRFLIKFPINYSVVSRHFPSVPDQSPWVTPNHLEYSRDFFFPKSESVRPHALGFDARWTKAPLLPCSPSSSFTSLQSKQVCVYIYSLSIRFCNQILVLKLYSLCFDF
jgi:hypothetical protein